MTPSETSELIESAGGIEPFARLLGIESSPGYTQRVSNWKRRGLPAAIALEHYDTIQRLRSQSDSRSRAAAPAA